MICRRASFFIVLLSAIFICMAMAQENSAWISFSDSYPEDACPSVRMSQSSPDGLVIEIEIPGMYLSEESADHRNFVSISVPPFDPAATQMVVASTSEEGKARLPILRAFIAIPEHAGIIEPEVVESSSCVLDDLCIYPAGSLVEHSSSISEEFAMDDDFYSSDVLYPPLLARAFGSSHLRDVRLACLEICPFQYNPARKQLTCHWKVRLHIPMSRSIVNGGVLSDMCSKTILTPPQTIQQAPSRQNIQKEGNVYYPTDLSGSSSADYLIITPEIFYENERVRELASWRAEYNGFDVAVVNIPDIYRQFGDGDVGIRNFVQHVYDQWTAPSSSDGHVAYALLVGDVEYVPIHITDYSSTFRYKSEGMATDNWYACVSGEDHLPDIMLGRLSVKNTHELGIFIDKIIQYEKNPNRGDWLKRVLLITGTIDNELDEFEYVKNEILLPAGYSVSEVCQLAGGNFEDIIYQINRGHIIVDYVGHGFRDGWEIFRDFHIPRFTNERMLPVIFSMACSTGAIDDADDCFAESMTKAANGGCVAYFGASRLAFVSDIAFSLSRGMVQNHLYILGELTMNAKLLCALSESDLQLYNLLGDPALSLYAPRASYYSKPDLAISPADITYDPEEPVHDCPVKINAVVHNIGEADAENVVVEFFRDGDTQKLIGERKIESIPQKGTGEVSIWWQPPHGKARNRILVEANSLSGEDYSYDNHAVKALCVSIDAKGFPVSANTEISSKTRRLSPPVLLDLDNDGYMELIVQGERYSSSSFYVCAWHHDGTLVQGFPVDILAADQYGERKSQLSPAAGDLDSDGFAEIACTFRTKKVYLLHHDGRIAKGFPVQLRAYAASSPVLYDIDSDGELEIILALTNGEVDVFRADGTQFDGFPVFVHSNRQFAFAPPTIAVGDVDGDGEPEIAVRFLRLDGYLAEYVFLNHDGSSMEDSPMEIPCANLLPLSLGDIDNDHHAELILASEERGIRALNHNNTLLPGFPVETEHEITSPPALGDVDGDGLPEIVATTLDYVYAWSCDGTNLSGFPIYMRGGNSYPILADVDGDNRSEIIFVNKGIHAYHHDGSPVDGFPINRYGHLTFSSLSLADVDADGYLEMAVVAGYDQIHLLDDVGIYNPGRIEWGSVLHDAQNTNSYNAEATLPMPGIHLRSASRHDGILLSWQQEFDLKDPTFYRVLRADFPTGPYVTLANLRKSQLMHVDSTAVVGVTYWYKVMAGNGTKAPIVSNITRALLEPTSEPILKHVCSYPNPAPSAKHPDSTTFSYHITEDAKVCIKIYSVNGQLVDEITHDAVGGIYNEVEWNISPIASGLYIYVIEATGGSGKKVNSKGKLAVIK